MRHVAHKSRQRVFVWHVVQWYIDHDICMLGWDYYIGKDFNVSKKIALKRYKTTKTLYYKINIKIQHYTLSLQRSCLKVNVIICKIKMKHHIKHVTN